MLGNDCFMHVVQPYLNWAMYVCDDFAKILKMFNGNMIQCVLSEGGKYKEWLKMFFVKMFSVKTELHSHLWPTLLREKKIKS